MGYLFLALAAAFVATDKFFGFSSGWIRYIRTGQVLMKELAEFRMDWAMLMAKRGEPPAPKPILFSTPVYSPPTGEQIPFSNPFDSLPTAGQIPFSKSVDAPPTGEQIQLMIQRIKEFVITVNGHVEQETLIWIAEFQSSLAEIERSVKTQEEASKPGAIEVTVTNGMDTEAGFQVILDGLVVAHVRGTQHQIGYVAPGHHKISVTGMIKGKALDASELVIVSPGVTAKATLAFPVEEAQPCGRLLMRS
jgi:hypothetical protein